MSDAAYHHWRELKRRADAMLRDRPMILPALDQLDDKNRKKPLYSEAAILRHWDDDYWGAWLDLKREIAAHETAHADDLQHWRKLARQELLRGEQ